jgi:type VI protein secretion system component Hcp
MSDKPTYDIVMLFQDQDGKPVYAESALGVSSDDRFMDGFKSADYDQYSNFFEVKTFNFKLSVKPDDKEVGALSSHGSAGQPVSFPGRTPAAQDAFSRWRSASEKDYKNIAFPILFDEFTFTRIIDGASPIFFGSCLNQKDFKKAVLVRRVASGLRGGKERMAVGFLRLEFEDIRLVSIDWDDGELVEETVTFICKDFKVKYRQQQADSGLLKSSESHWNQTRNGMANNSRQR